MANFGASIKPGGFGAAFGGAGAGAAPGTTGLATGAGMFGAKAATTKSAATGLTLGKPAAAGAFGAAAAPAPAFGGECPAGQIACCLACSFARSLPACLHRGALARAERLSNAKIEQIWRWGA